ncbi:MAG: cob(I)yrinic acid a,c-diamide adenosyltransferase [Parvularculaceae bacterium]|nr:cob(I)yrinic acid a,c-diamide adenosyltransferase [Parvularculaceae bacterium]
MPDRLSCIVTRGGDKGETSLGDGSRVSKTDGRVALLGDVDELNAQLGVCISREPGTEVGETLLLAQHDLFDFGGALCFPGETVLTEHHVARLDAAALALNATLPPLKEFVLPGGAPLVAALHVARTVCRRVERAAVGFFDGSAAGAHAVPYLNRLSDYLFIACRFESRRLGVAEVLWQKGKSVGGAS